VEFKYTTMDGPNQGSERMNIHNGELWERFENYILVSSTWTTPASKYNYTATIRRI